jgi:hypothetical protein
MRSVLPFVAAVLALGAPAQAASDSKSESTAHFIAYCDAHPDEFTAMKGHCVDDLAMASIMLMVNGRNAVCLPDITADKDQANVLRAVLAWLKSHPELADTPHADSMETAYKTLYPCP